MADNTGEEHLDNPIHNQSESPPGDIKPATDKKTFIPNQKSSSFADLSSGVLT